MWRNNQRSDRRRDARVYTGGVCHVRASGGINRNQKVATSAKWRKIISVPSQWLYNVNGVKRCCWQRASAQRITCTPARARARDAMLVANKQAYP